jgi:hypothetical protein
MDLTIKLLNLPKLKLTLEKASSNNKQKLVILSA